MVNIEDIGVSDLRRLNASIRNVLGFDFSDYAPSSFKRRIGRIIQIHHFEDINALIKRVETDKSYLPIFLDEITVNTTEMFRDPSFWVAIKKDVLPLFKDFQNIRIWHAGCSSGEEVYTMCMVLKEAGMLEKARIYASDINTNVIDKAKSGIYSLKNMELNNFNYNQFGGKNRDLTSYGKEEDGFFKMDLDLIKDVKFKEVNLVTDHEPFMKFDLILCRNVMIYFNTQLQEKIYDLYYNSLVSNGFMVIGAKESMFGISTASKFEEFVREERIYRRK